MKSLKEDKQVVLGRAIAQGMNEINIQKERNMAKAERRKATMLENAAEKALLGKL